MKDLQEMSLQEMRETEGGIWGLIALGIFILIAYICATDDNPDTVTTVNGQRVGY